MKKFLSLSFAATLSFAVFFAASCRKKAPMAAPDSFFNGNVRLMVPYEEKTPYAKVAVEFVRLANESIRAKGLGGNIYCEYRSGGDSVLAASDFAENLPDARELLLTPYGLWYTHAAIGDGMGFDISEIQPVASIDDRSSFLYVGKGMFADFGDLASRTSRRRLKVSGGDRSEDVFSLSALGVECEKVRCGSAEEGIQAVADGVADAFVGDYGDGFRAVEEGILVPVLYFGGEDFTGFAKYIGRSVPCAASAGYPAADVFRGDFISAPAGTDARYIGEIAALVSEVVKSDAFAKFAFKSGFRTSDRSTPELDKHIARMKTDAGECMKMMGIV